MDIVNHSTHSKTEVSHNATLKGFTTSSFEKNKTFQTYNLIHYY